MKVQPAILDFDKDRNAVVDPQRVIKKNESMPEHCILCYSQEVIDSLLSRNEITEIALLRSEMGKHPIYIINGTEPKVALFQPGIGAPLSAGLFEEAIALGAKKFIACGGAGTLNSSTPPARIMIPIEAIRDEGTSYHYLPPDEKVYPTKKALSSLVNFLKETNVPYVMVKTWTTDAVYRETKGKINLRKRQGCECVEMETAALFAVAKFRNVEFAQILFSGDDVGGEVWDEREWRRGLKSVREKVFSIATKACQYI